MPNLISAKTTTSFLLKPILSGAVLALVIGIAAPGLAMADPAQMPAETKMDEKSAKDGQTHSSHPDADSPYDSEDQNSTVMTPAIMPTKADYFNAADFDDNGQLNRGEFELYVDTIADSGDAIAISIRDGQTYEAAFIQADVNDSSALSLEELSSETEDE